MDQGRKAQQKSIVTNICTVYSLCNICIAYNCNDLETYYMYGDTVYNFQTCQIIFKIIMKNPIIE